MLARRIRSRPRWRIRQQPRFGFSLIEVLVTVGIFGLLIALLLPAVQSSREAARRTQCQNNLKQLGVAMFNHESQFGRLPANGWGWAWLGEPDRGTDRRQPGGWIFNLLPYLDKGAERELGTTVVTQGSAAKWDMSRLTQVPLAIFTCPSRRPVALSAHRPGQPLRNAAWAPAVAKSDYAVCEGDFITNTPEGPLTLVEGDDPNYPWTDVSQATGVCFLRSEIRWVDIRDGTSETYLIGEKYVGRTNYDTHLDAGHDQCMYTGVDLDINRWTLEPPLPDMDFMSPRRFGSAHPGGCHFLFCDGSVRMMSYFIHRDVHRRLGNRRDGQPLTGAF